MTGDETVRSSRTTWGLPLGLCAVTLLTSAPAGAQHISLSPAIGLYVPTKELVTAVTGGGQLKQEVSVTFGGRLGIWFGKRIGIEATGNYAPSNLKFSTSGVPVQSANIFTGSGRLLVFLIPDSSPLSLRLTGGVGLVNRSGTAYQAVTDKTDIAGTGGVALGFRLGPIIHLFTAADAYVYEPKFTGGLAGLRQNQMDVHLSFGIGLPLLGLGK
jgi:hypothetical protein